MAAAPTIPVAALSQSKLSNNMKRLIFLLLIIPCVSNAQIRLDQTPELDSLESTDAVYTAERGSVMKITLGVLKTWITSEITAPAPSVPTLDTLSASGETSMRIRYTGSSAPTLSRQSEGNYLLSIPSGTDINGFVWYESGATFTSGAIRLTIRDADGESSFGIYRVIQGATGDEIGQLGGIVIRQTTPLAGDVLVEFPNMSSVSGDFIIIGKPF